MQAYAIEQLVFRVFHANFEHSLAEIMGTETKSEENQHASCARLRKWVAVGEVANSARLEWAQAPWRVAPDRAFRFSRRMNFQQLLDARAPVFRHIFAAAPVTFLAKSVFAAPPVEFVARWTNFITIDTIRPGAKAFAVTCGKFVAVGSVRTFGGVRSTGGASRRATTSTARARITRSSSCIPAAINPCAIPSL